MLTSRHGRLLPFYHYMWMVLIRWMIDSTILLLDWLTIMIVIVEFPSVIVGFSGG